MSLERRLREVIAEIDKIFQKYPDLEKTIREDPKLECGLILFKLAKRKLHAK